MSVFYCPECNGENLERPFAFSKELFGYSWHCLDCNWRGLSAGFDRDPRPDVDERPEREPFTDWPNGQGTYD
jgi:hypothetical protein